MKIAMISLCKVGKKKGQKDLFSLNNENRS